jgi:hypothetical protein
MKKFLTILLALLPFHALAALNAGTIWEVRGNGSDTNGGGFTATFTINLSKTDLVISAGASNKVSSATYVFTSADVGRFIKITAGTGFITGIYGPITAVTGGVATLDRSAGAISSSGGSFSVYYGIDYSQQNAKNSSGSNISTTDAVANGTTAITSATGNFTHDIIGSVIYFSGGNGSIAAQRRAVTGFTSATAITIDTAIASSTGMTMNIGGALGDLGEAFSARGIISGNRIWWKNDTGLSSSTALSTGIASLDLFGYNGTRGDITNTLGTNRPTFTFTGTGAPALTYTGTGTANFQNFVLNANSGSGNYGVESSAGNVFVYNVTAENYDSIGIYQITGGSVICHACEAVGGTSNATAGIDTRAGAVYNSSLLSKLAMRW